MDEMITGKTTSGFEFSYSAQKSKSMTFTDMIVELVDEDNEFRQIKKLTAVFTYLFGDDIKDRLKAFVTEQVGYDDAEMVMKEMFEILRIIKEGNLKKSSSSPKSSEQTGTI